MEYIENRFLEPQASAAGRKRCPWTRSPQQLHQLSMKKFLFIYKRNLMSCLSRAPRSGSHPSPRGTKTRQQMFTQRQQVCSTPEVFPPIAKTLADFLFKRAKNLVKEEQSRRLKRGLPLE